MIKKNTKHCPDEACKQGRKQWPCQCCACVSKRNEAKASWARFRARQEEVSL